LQGNDVTEEKWRRYIRDAGFDLVGFKNAAQPSNRDVSQLPVYASYQLAKQVFQEATEKPEAIYIPCARWQAIKNIARLEDDLGVAVVTSVQAWVWKALQEVNVREVQPGYGQLFSGWSEQEGF
jgi:maleate isomerase